MCITNYESQSSTESLFIQFRPSFSVCSCLSIHSNHNQSQPWIFTLKLISSPVFRIPVWSPMFHITGWEPVFHITGWPPVFHITGWQTKQTRLHIWYLNVALIKLGLLHYTRERLFLFVCFSCLNQLCSQGRDSLCNWSCNAPESRRVKTRCARWREKK